MPIDPITLTAIASSLGQVGGQIASNIGSKKREAEYKAKADTQQKKFDLARERIANIDFSPGSGIYEVEQQRKLQAELLGSEADRRGDERESRALAALQDSPRQMQAIAPRLISQSEDAAQKADLQVGQLKVDATKATAAAEQSAEDQARKRDMMLEQLDMQRAGKSFDTYTEGMLGERAARAEGNRALISELGETAIAVGGNIANIKTAEAARDAALAQQDFSKSLQTDQTDIATDAIQNPIEQYGDFIPDDADPIGQYGPFIPDGPLDPVFEDTLPENQPGFDPYDVIYGGAQGAHGLLIGKDGGLTKGEYSHETNKKAIIDEEDGKKEGELTGGEFVLPPYFVAKMEELIKQGKYEEAGKEYEDFTSAPRFQEA